MPPPRFLVCAGSTREMIDRVRDWGNIFTGGTGFDLARTLSALGPVDLLTSNPEHRAAAPLAGQGHAITAYAFRSHAELRAGIAERWAAAGYAAVCMSAAVSDYTPDGCVSIVQREPAGPGEELWRVRDAQAGKVSSQHQAIAVAGRRTEKLVDLFRAWGFAGVLVKFKLEVGIGRERLIAVGEASRSASGADLLVANTLEMVAGAEPGAIILGDGMPRWTARQALAGEVARLVAVRLGLPPAEPAVPALALALADQVRALAGLLRTVPAAAYADRGGGAAIGEHVRHVLDHHQAVLRGLDDGIADYERRRRGWPGEIDPAIALGELDAVADRFAQVRAGDLLRRVEVRCCIDPAQPPAVVASTVGRELLFAQSHAVHHDALIAVLLARHGIAPAPGFGLAPSTRAHLACAPSP